MAEVRESRLIKGVFHVVPDSHGDERGWFMETYRQEWFPTNAVMVQSNRSYKARGSVVGLHYHLKQSDFWFAQQGSIRVVLHDLRIGSPTASATEVFEFAGDRPTGVFIPPGVGHGFASLTDATLTYLVDAYYNPADELGVAWDDPELGLAWGVEQPVLSARDRDNPRKADIPPGRMPHWAKGSE